MLGGMLAGMAGAFLTLAAVGLFEQGMTTGRGFIALAVMIFGNWKPSGALKGSLLFGFAMALQNQLQLFGINFPHQLVGMLPYILTIVVLAGRSEEHTSELQSRENLVCRLLLEKKNIKI